MEFFDLKIAEPTEDENFDCHLQQVGLGSLVCRCAKQDGTSNSTNNVTPAICFSCPIGKIYREIGCDAPSTNISIRYYSDSPYVTISGIFCKIRRRPTTYEYCHSCSLVTAESTRQVISATRGLFQSSKFYAAYQDLEKARIAIRDGEFDRSITHSIACVESTCRLIHDELDEKLPSEKSLSDLWKSTRKVLELDTLGPESIIAPLLNSLSGVVTHLGAIRNVLSDAHGKGKISPQVSESYAELALNTASTIATFAVRHFKTKDITSEE